MRIPRLGEVLIEKGAVTQEQVDEAVMRAKEYGLRLGQALIIESDCSDKVIADALAEIHGLERVELHGFQVDVALLAAVRKRNVERLRAIPLKVVKRGDKDVLAVATAQPENIDHLDELRAATGMEIEPRVATESDISSVIREIFGHDITPVQPNMTFIDVVVHQFTRGTDQALFLQEGRCPIVINERRRAPRPEQDDRLSPYGPLGRGHHRTLDQYHPISVENLEDGIRSLLNDEDFELCRHDGQVCASFRSHNHGRFKISVINYRKPGDTSPVGREFAYTLRVDRLTKSGSMLGFKTPVSTV